MLIDNRFLIVKAVVGTFNKGKVLVVAFSVIVKSLRTFVYTSTTRCSITINNVTAGDWGDWMCLVQDGLVFDKDQEYISVEVARPARAAITWGDTREEDIAEVEAGLLRVIEDTVTRVQCRAWAGYPRPRVTWAAGEGVAVRPTNTHVFGDSVSYDNSSHSYSLVSSLLYTAATNHTNSTISCRVSQAGLYTQVQTLTLMVDPKPLPLIKVSHEPHVSVVTEICGQV